MPHYMIVDCETSHLFDYEKDADASGQPRLAQLGLIHVGTDMREEARHEFLIKPEGWEMSAEATEKTGLTTQYLKDHGMPIADALALYRAGIEARRVIVGFNVQFDLKMMRAELRRAGHDDSYLETRNICLMWGSRAIVNALDARGKVKIPKLEEACAFFGIEQPQAHSALADADSAYKIMQRLLVMGKLPTPKSPYDKKAKKPKAKLPRPRFNEEDDAEQDFIGGANAGD